MKKLIGAVMIGGLLLACSAGDVGQAQQEFGETNCQTQTITAPNGSIVTSYGTKCSNHSFGSVDATYGYTNCTWAYLWEFDNIASGANTLTLTITPVTAPPNASVCGRTHVDARVIGYSATSNGGSVIDDYDVYGGQITGVWNMGLGVCTFPGNTITFSTTNFHGTGNSIASFRVEAQATVTSTGFPITTRVAVGGSLADVTGADGC